GRGVERRGRKDREDRPDDIGRRRLSLPETGRVAEAVRPKPGGGGEAIQALSDYHQALPTRSLRDYPPRDGEGETRASPLLKPARTPILCGGGSCCGSRRRQHIL